jgi:hypothetical protein
MIRPTSRKSSSSNPRIVAAGVPRRTPEATVGALVEGDRVQGRATREAFSHPSPSTPSGRSSRDGCRCPRQPSGRRPAAGLTMFARTCTAAAEAAILHVVSLRSRVSGPPWRPGRWCSRSRASPRQRTRRPRAGEVLCVVEVTTHQSVTGLGCSPAATRPARVRHVAPEKRANIVAIFRTPTSRPCAIGRPPHRITFGRCSFATQHLGVVDRCSSRATRSGRSCRGGPS